MSIYSLKTEGDTKSFRKHTLRFAASQLTQGKRDSHNSFREFCRIISTPWLKGLLPFHRAPINVVISHDPITIPNLGVGFPLRCFQRLSVPDIATGRCTWRYSPQTRGQFISVLSSLLPQFLGAQTISSTFSHSASEVGGMLPI